MGRKKVQALDVVIKTLRESLDPPTTATDFAMRIGMDPMRYWRLENGKTRLLAEDVEQIAKGLGVSIASLYGEARAS